MGVLHLWHEDALCCKAQCYIQLLYKPHLRIWFLQWRNVSTTPIKAMECWQCLPLTVVQMKGKRCRKPHCHNGVVDTFGQSFKYKRKKLLVFHDFFSISIQDNNWCYRLTYFVLSFGLLITIKWSLVTK